MKITIGHKQVKEIFNPLTALSKAGQLVSTSLTNMVEGECPKCKQSMGNAFVGKEEVHYCKNCRVCEPMLIG